ncbi:MAG: glycosyltransferase family 4 protein [Lachnospiraceae bacterium]|jgi:glycosyltransferase involved in cell wall biosynthesis|nr:glycosyltransferase family 4 protein [Lachnospiraceae bacterium]
MEKRIRVVMIGADRRVHGGVSAVVNNYYQAGLNDKVGLIYIGTMIDGSKGRKLLKAMMAFFHFLLVLPWMQILHVNMAADASFYRKQVFIKTAVRFNKRIVIHEHGGDFNGFYYERSGVAAQKGIRATLNMADRFIVLSKQWADFFRPLVSEEKLMVLENAIAIPPEGKRDHTGQAILFLGRLCREKGIGELLSAMPLLVESLPEVRLYLGGVWEDNVLAEQAKALGDLVTWLGWIDDDEKKRWMEECSIFVLPSYFEGQPVSLLEAMAAGMAVVSTAVGGIPQIIESGINGLLVEPGAVPSLTDGLKRLLLDEQLRENYGRAARERIIKDYDMAHRVEELVKIYERLKGEGNE